MCSNNEDNKNMVFTVNLSRERTDRTLSPCIFLMTMVLTSLIVFMIIPVAFAQSDSNLTGSLINGTLENYDGGVAENVSDNSSMNEAAAAAAAASNLGPKIQNLSLGSFSSFVDEINSKIRHTCYHVRRRYLPISEIYRKG